MTYIKISSAKVEGAPKKETNNPEEEAIFHTKLGQLYWELEDGTKVVVRSYIEYRQKVLGEERC